ncbi:amidohydrolase 2 [Aulographum hederae CBS 113979]|uniref:6-methylsalicylate decarboxylase n=1 Tax=Aulographum hederae CBS 113979 TaxID=1176131 RepID=A0A6G1H445_9PEZI|nr:amidohydrolase 2 [Aulographum hederae CBS 113979]
MSRPRRIDTHSHFLPDFYRDALHEAGIDHPDGMPAVPMWSETEHLKLMDHLNITKSILSISTPGIDLYASNPSAAASLARKVNAFAADLKRRHPTRFGYWASLPMPDIAATLTEIDAALAEGAEGVMFLTNHKGHYLGDKAFAPVFEKLNQVKARVFIHPTTPCIACEHSAGLGGREGEIVKATPLSWMLPNPMMEFFFDTARTVTDLFLTGRVKANPDITFIIPHAGGCMPPILSRFTGFAGAVPDAGIDPDINETKVREAFNRQFYFDMAGFVFPGQIYGLLIGCGVGKDRLLYGSDYPYTPFAAAVKLADLCDGGTEAWSGEEREMAYFGNAIRLLGEEK